jgi:hypothetical protein
MERKERHACTRRVESGSTAVVTGRPDSLLFLGIRITVLWPSGVKVFLSDAAQPRDAGGLPRGANVSRDRIVRAAIKRSASAPRQKA